MQPKKTLQQREKELQSLLATDEGRAELQTLVDRYSAAEGGLMPASRSAITYILVAERGLGLIRG